MSLYESTVEDAAADSFGGLGFARLRGVEIDDAGERTGIETALLATRLAEDSADSILAPSAASRERRLGDE
jgi:hypothetical protein